jgi:hypothetical protein
MGFGAIIRDFMGRVVAASSCTQGSITDPIVAEAVKLGLECLLQSCARTRVFFI